MDNKLSKRILMSVLGVLVCGISVGMFKRAELGVDPFQALMSGLDLTIPISFGTLYVIVNVLLLLFSILMDRTKIGIATFINLFLFGYVADFTRGVLQRLLPGNALPMRLMLLLIAIPLTCLASSFYFTANLGVSTYDAISLVISEKNEKIQFRFCRIVSDLICVGIGVALFLLSGSPLSAIGQVVGIGTIITAFFMGPLIDFFNRKVAQPFLNR